MISFKNFSFHKRKQEKTVAVPEKMTTDNILDVFSKDMKNDSLKSDSAEKDTKKDQIYYIKKATTWVKVLFFISLFCSLIAYWYSYVQKSETLENLSYLNPICELFLTDDVQAEIGKCTWLANARSIIEERKTLEYKKQTEEILSILPDVYSLDNFLFTNEISFLLNKSATKLPVTEILAEFDALKDAFEPSKGVYTVDCSDMTIENSWQVILSCSSYTSNWSESNIIWFNGQVNSKKISWTSITVASSFINFIKNKSQSFKVLEATKSYNYDSNMSDGKQRYTRKTDFEMVLDYSPKLEN